MGIDSSHLFHLELSHVVWTAIRNRIKRIAIQGGYGQKLDRSVPGLEVRMHDRDDVELALSALGEGWSARAAGELAGVSRETARGWRRGRVSHERCGIRATLAARDPTDRERP